MPILAGREHLKRDSIDTGYLDDILGVPTLRGHHFCEEFARGVPDGGIPSSQCRQLSISRSHLKYGSVDVRVIVECRTSDLSVSSPVVPVSIDDVGTPKAVR